MGSAGGQSRAGTRRGSDEHVRQDEQPGSYSMAMRLLGGRRDLRMELTRTLQLRHSGLDHYLIEMLDQESWIEGIRYMLANQQFDGRMWPHFRGEDQVWL